MTIYSKKDIVLLTSVGGAALVVISMLIIGLYQTGRESMNTKRKECAYIMSTARSTADSLEFISNVSYCTQFWLEQRQQKDSTND